MGKHLAKDNQLTTTACKEQCLEQLKSVINTVEIVLPGKSDVLLLAMAASVGHLVDKETPLWLILVGPPSSAKTEIVRLLTEMESSYFLDTLTDNAFVSGARSHNGSQPKDLLPLLDQKCFIIKDLTTTLSQKEESIRKILGDLTSIYDASFAKHSPQRGTVTYKSFFSLLGCVTPQAINRHQRYMSQIGPRFLFYRIGQSSEINVERSLNAVWASDTGEKQRQARKLVSDYINNVAARLTQNTVEINAADSKVYLNSLAKFVAQARGIVTTRAAEYTSKQGSLVKFYEPIETQVEEPYRALKQLRALARSLAAVCGRNEVHQNDLRLVRDVAMSSMPADRSLLISVIAKEQRPWTANEVAKALGVSHRTTLRQLDELVSLEILFKEEGGAGLANCYGIVDKFIPVLYGDEFMSRFDTKTQTPPRPQNEGGTHLIDNLEKPLIEMSSQEQLALAQNIFGLDAHWMEEEGL